MQHRAGHTRKVVTPLQIKQNKATEESHNKQHIVDIVKFKRYCDNADTVRGGAATQLGATTPSAEVRRD